MTNAYCTIEDVREAAAGDGAFSTAKDASIAKRIIEISRELDRMIAICRGVSEDIFSFVADQLFDQHIVYLSSTPPPSSGTFRLMHQGQITGPIDHDATAAIVQTELENLSSVGAGQVSVTGFDGGPYTVQWADQKSGPQGALSGRASFDVTTAGITVLPTIVGVPSVPSARRFTPTPSLYGFLLPIDDAVEVNQVTVDGSVVDWQPYPLSQLPVVGLKPTAASDWTEWPSLVEVTARWGYSVEVPADVRECTVLEVIRAYYAAQAGNDDRLGMTPFGSVTTAKAWTDKTMKLKDNYGKRLW